MLYTKILFGNNVKLKQQVYLQAFNDARHRYTKNLDSFFANRMLYFAENLFQNQQKNDSNLAYDEVNKSFRKKFVPGVS